MAPAARVCAALLAAWLLVPTHVDAVEGSLEYATTLIAVKLDDRLSSQDEKAGDSFSFELTGSVILDGVAVGAGTKGRGIVLAAEPGAGPHHGSLTVQAQTIDLPDGRHVPVALGPGSLDRGPGRDTRGFVLPVGTTSVYVGSNRDNNVVYEKGTRFTVVAPPPATPEPDASP